MKRELSQPIKFWVQGGRVSSEIVPGRALYFDAILESNQDTVFAVGECEHKDCVRVPGLEAGPFFWSLVSYLRGKACFVHDLFPIDKLIERCDYFGVPLNTVVDSVDRALDDFAPCDFALAHSKKYEQLLSPLFQESAYPNWPRCKVLRKPRATEACLKDVYDAIMAEPGVGTWLERLTVVRTVNPDTVAILDIPNVFEPEPSLDDGVDFAPTGASAHETMCRVVGRDVLMCLPQDAVVMGSVLTYHVGCLPFESNKLTIYVRDAADVQAVIECLPKVEVVHTTETVPSLLMRCVRRSGQLAWIPDKQQVVATLECWRVLVTSRQEDESEIVLWPCAAPSSLDLQQPVVLMTPLVLFDCGKLRYQSSWSDEHATFDNLVDRVYELLRTERPQDFTCYSLLEVPWCTVFWGRFKICADLSQKIATLSWGIRAYCAHEPSPLVMLKY